MTQQPTPRIAIVGGGPGGLTLARILHLRGIPATVFEREGSPNERPQGGTLDLHPRSGQRAIHLAGLDEAFRAIARYEDQGMRLLDNEGTVLFEEDGADGEGDRPEVDRTALRAILLDALPPGTVRWRSNLRAIRAIGDGIHELIFADGRRETFDLVVGADGAWSRIRPLLSDATPQYTGVTFIEVGFGDVDERYPAIAALVGHGSMAALAENKGLIAQRNGHGHIRAYATLRVPEGWAASAGIADAPPEAMRAMLLDQFAGWSPRLLVLLRECDDRFVARPLYMLPIGHRWDAHPGVTLLGDAAHLMPPSSGEGVNLAMLDAAELALALGGGGDRDAAVREYEEALFARAARSAAGAARGLEVGDSASALVYFRDHAGEGAA